MKRFHILSALLVVFVGMAVDCTGIQSGSSGDSGGGGGGSGGGKKDGQQPTDPAEQAAIDVVKKHGGHSTLEGGHVVAVAVFQPSFTNDDLKPLASLPKVRKIQINSTKMTGEGLKQFAGLKNLSELEVSQNPINDAGLKEIATLTNLRYLGMNGAKVSDPTFRELKALGKLEELHACGMMVGDSAAFNIAENLKHLKKLYMNNTQVGDVGVAEIAKMPEINTLSLYGTRVTDAGLAALPNLKTLEVLELSFGFTDNSAKIIAGCTNLRTLRLFNNRELTDKGLQELGRLPNLRELEIRGGQISAQAKADFIKAHPNCAVK
jgi:Leucine-rich repeat (LRR) protein